MKSHHTEFLADTDDTLQLENYFHRFRKGTIGQEHVYDAGYGPQKLVYADWIASGRLYRPIEDIICDKIGPLMANTHSFSSESGKASTYAYQHARKVIKDHVNAGKDDILVTTGTGMTGALAKLIRLLNLPKKDLARAKDQERPVVFITHMEHHSNQVPWFELEVDVVILEPGEDLIISPETLKRELKKYDTRTMKIGAFTACSNVTGAITPYYELAAIMHAAHGLCFVDFAASAPYVGIDMHPTSEDQKLDAIFFSPHKFLGGPGTCGVLVFDKKLYSNAVPDTPGGGNVKWTSPLGNHGYHADAETREDGGTPGILQVIRTALCIKLKKAMNPELMHLRERQLLNQLSSVLKKNKAIKIIGNPDLDGIGCLSFNIEGLHYNLVVRLLNDRFGIQVRGGWSCASSYAHYLFDIQEMDSTNLINDLENNNLTQKPGWVRVSLHPIMTDAEVDHIINAIEEIIEKKEEWSKDYAYSPTSNEFESSVNKHALKLEVEAFFDGV